MWWHTPLIQAHERQADLCNFAASLSCLPPRPPSKKKKKKSPPHKKGKLEAQGLIKAKIAKMVEVDNGKCLISMDFQICF